MSKSSIHALRETEDFRVKPSGDFTGTTRASLLRQLLDKHVEPVKGTTIATTIAEDNS